MRSHSAVSISRITLNAFEVAYKYETNFKRSHLTPFQVCRNFLVVYNKYREKEMATKEDPANKQLRIQVYIFYLSLYDLGKAHSCCFFL